MNFFDSIEKDETIDYDIYSEVRHYITSVPNNIHSIAILIEKNKHMYSEASSFNNFLLSSYNIFKTVIGKIYDFLKWFVTKVLDMAERSLRELKNDASYVVKLSKKGPPRILENDRYTFVNIYQNYGGADILDLCFNTIYNTDRLLSVELTNGFNMKNFFEDTIPELADILSSDDDMAPLMSKVAEAYYNVKAYTNGFGPEGSLYRFRCFLYNLFNHSGIDSLSNKTVLLDSDKYDRSMKPIPIIDNMFFNNTETVYHGEEQVRKLHDSLLQDVTKANSMLMSSSTVIFDKVDKGLIFFKQVRNKLESFENEYERLVGNAISENEAEKGVDYTQRITEHMMYITTLSSFCCDNILRLYTLGEHCIIKECLYLHRGIDILNHMYQIYAV